MANRKEICKTLVALVPLVVLVGLLALDISIFGSDAVLGASQVALLVATGICVWLSMWLYKTPWTAFEEAIRSNVGDVTSAIVILLLIGALSGAWTVSGVVPTFIYYGLKIISPKIFLLSACVICALVSVMVGSSWTTIATIGVALMGIGKAEGFSDGLIAGAIISGAYFGDKISPLSDTTVMASSINRVPLFTHIRYLMITTVPSIVIALIIFMVLGLAHDGTPAVQIAQYSEALAGTFNLTPWLLVVPLVTGILIARKQPALIVLAISTLLAAVFAVIFQPELVARIGAPLTDGSRARVLFAGTVESLYNSVTVATGNPEVDALVSSRGMLGMLNTIYLIICAMCFGGCMRASGMLRQVSKLILPLARNRFGLVSSTVLTGTALNGIVSDQYLSIILTSDIFRDTFDKQGYEHRLLSRSVEDSSTVTSPLIPWSSCGMTQSTILHVPTIAYLPYCFFNWISPLMSITIAAIGYRIYHKKAA
ncbi:MAG: Na+/H+ antiporter NhaC family protein [Bacteroidales bacterium]|nr:Na+/H+ antiporter NhaC family protein [Bacteroidales bacterium]